MIKLIEILNEYTLNDTLNPNVWVNGKIKPKLLNALLKIAQKFYKDLDISSPLKDIILTGSSANYNWTKYSDIDLHLLIDFSNLNDPDVSKKYFDSKKNEFNEKYNLKYKNQPIEVYVQDINEPHAALGVYSLLNQNWIKEPKREDINIPDSEIDKKAQPLIDKINDLINDNTTTTDDIKNLKSKIKQFRQNGLEDNGEYSLENLAFKKLRNDGYLEKLRDLEKNITIKSFDLNQVDEDQKRIPRKPGQPAKSKQHSDLYTDEDPKGTITGLGFKDASTAKQGISKINKAKTTHAHKVQATLVMKQRAKVAMERTKDPEKKKKLKAAYQIWSKKLEQLKAKTKKMRND